MKNAQDYSALLEFIAMGVTIPEDLAKTIIFVNSLQKTLEIQRFLRRHFPALCHHAIEIFHALCSQ